MSLQGLSVLVTRPAHQAESLCCALERAGAQALRLPAIDIQPLSPAAVPLDDIYDWIIFTSPNAVHFGLPHCSACLGQARIAAIGAASAQALREAGCPDVLMPSRDYSSAGLLAEAALQAVAAQRVLLVKGEGGRIELAGTLRKRGAHVQVLEVYRRRRLTLDPDDLGRAISSCDAAVVTSGEILQQLDQQTPAGLRSALHALQLVVPSERVVQMAHTLGFSRVLCVPSPLTETAIVQALQGAWHKVPASGQ